MTVITAPIAVPEVFRDLFNDGGPPLAPIEEPDRPAREPREPWSRLVVFLIGVTTVLAFFAGMVEGHRVFVLGAGL